MITRLVSLVRLLIKLFIIVLPLLKIFAETALFKRLKNKYLPSKKEKYSFDQAMALLKADRVKAIGRNGFRLEKIKLDREEKIVKYPKDSSDYSLNYHLSEEDLQAQDWKILV